MGYIETFEEVLEFLNQNYRKFPKFLIEIIAENYGIPPSEIKILMDNYRKRGILTILKNEGYYFILNK